jgi:hypothetical protein
VDLEVDCGRSRHGLDGSDDRNIKAEWRTNPVGDARFEIFLTATKVRRTCRLVTDRDVVENGVAHRRNGERHMCRVGAFPLSSSGLARRVETIRDGEAP